MTGVVGQQVSPSPGRSATAAVDKGGRVNIAWERSGDIEVVQCQRDTTGFICSPRTVFNNASLGISSVGPSGRQIRVDGFPRVAADRLEGGNDQVYVVWTDRQSGNTDILFAASTDNSINRPIGNALSFTNPISLPGNGPTDEFMPAITIDSFHGIHVVFYSRDDQAGSTFNLYQIVSVDGGQNWTDREKLNDGPPIEFSTQWEIGSTGRFFMGDYIGVDSLLHSQAAWDDTRTGDQAIFAHAVILPSPTPTGTGTPTRTRSATPTRTRTPGPTPTRGPCFGDCNGNGEVTVDELITGVNIALGAAPLGSCPRFDTDGNGMVTVDELVAAVNAALNGCIATVAAAARAQLSGPSLELDVVPLNGCRGKDVSVWVTLKKAQ